MENRQTQTLEALERPSTRLVQTRPPVQVERQYLYGVQGLRTVAALMVAVYHIWFHRVSGGVDVFFVVAGYFAGFSTQRILAAENTKQIWVKTRDYLLRTMRRVVPSSSLVVLFTVIASMLWLPSSSWDASIAGAWASLLFFQNQHLITVATDYMQWGGSVSPFQQFWALSIQVQFYVAFALLAFAVAVIARRFNASAKRIFTILTASIFAASLAFSIYYTAVNQQVSYFRFATRFWEFLFGALLVWLVAALQLPSRAAKIIGWTGLFVIIGAPYAVDFSDLLPGSFALVPLFAAGAVILSSKHSAEPSILRNRAILWAADSSFAFYLWHWPILVFYRLYWSESVSLPAGLIIIVAALVLAVATTKLVEIPFRNWSRLRERPALSLMATALLLVLPIGALLSWETLLDRLGTGEVSEASAEIDGLLPTRSNSENRITPALHLAKDDVPFSYEEDCHQDLTSPSIIRCEWGMSTAEETLAVIGGSHEAQWLDVALETAYASGTRLISMTKSNCPFGLPPLEDESRDVSCHEWSTAVLNELLADPPTAVMVVITESSTGVESVPEWKTQSAQTLLDAGIPVIGIRDNPRFSMSVPDCIELWGENECSQSADRLFVRDQEISENIDDPLFTFVDMKEDYCPGGQCTVLQSGILVYRDDNHLTRTWTLANGEKVRRAVLDVLAVS